MRQWFLGVTRVCRGHHLDEQDWLSVVAFLLPAGIYQDWVWRHIESAAGSAGGTTSMGRPDRRVCEVQNVTRCASSVVSAVPVPASGSESRPLGFSSLYTNDSTEQKRNLKTCHIHQIEFPSRKSKKEQRAQCVHC